jgi:DNA-binding LacI/PurR family transcriptional regulator
MQAAKEMGYDPARSHAARHLASQRFGQRVLNNMIGLLFAPEKTSSAQTEYTTRVLSGVMAGATSRHFDVCTSDTGHVIQGMELPMVYRKGLVDGVLTLSPRRYSQPEISLLRGESGFGDRPILSLVEHIPGASGVFADNFMSGEAAITHLLDLGHRYFAHFEHHDDIKIETSARAQRYAAYQEACRTRGMDPAKHLIEIPWMYGHNYRSESKQRLAEEIRAHPEITAIIAHDDLQAGDVFDALRDAGYSIPKDISLISYDDTNPVVENRDNILTTVRLPLEEVGCQGAKMLIRRILGEETEDRDVLLPVNLIIRRSTAPPFRRIRNS